MTDDRPWAEFAAPKLMYERHVSETLEQLIPHLESPLTRTSFDGFPQDETEALREAIERRHQARRIDLEGVSKYYGGMIGGGQEKLFVEALALDPGDSCARHYLLQIAPAVASQYLRWEKYEQGIELLTKVLSVLPDNPELVLLLGDFWYAKGDFNEALGQYTLYKTLGGTDARALERIEELAGNAAEQSATSRPDAPPAGQNEVK